MYKQVLYYVTVVVSACIIAAGAYVFSSSTELNFSDGLHEISLKWFQPSTVEAPVPGHIAEPLVSLTGSIVDNRLTLTGSIAGAEFDHAAQPPVPFGDLFLNVDGKDQYVFDLDFENSSYHAYRLNGFDSIVQVHSNPTSNTLEPYRYVSGGSSVGSGDFSFAAGGGSGGGGSGGGGAIDEPPPVEFVLEGFVLPEFEGEEERLTSFSDEPDGEFTDGLSKDTAPEGGSADSPAPVPEPASLLLLGVGLAALGWLRKQRQSD